MLKSLKFKFGNYIQVMLSYYSMMIIDASFNNIAAVGKDKAHHNLYHARIMYSEVQTFTLLTNKWGETICSNN